MQRGLPSLRNLITSDRIEQTRMGLSCVQPTFPVQASCRLRNPPRPGRATNWCPGLWESPPIPPRATDNRAMLIRKDVCRQAHRTHSSRGSASTPRCAACLRVCRIVRIRIQCNGERRCSMRLTLANSPGSQTCSFSKRSRSASLRDDATVMKQRRQIESRLASFDTRCVNGRGVCERITTFRDAPRKPGQKRGTSLN